MIQANNEYDVAIIGGGPTGLSAALVLGRSLKRTAVFDNGPPRNTPAKAVHGFLTQDGTPPDEMRRIAHEQMTVYDSVDFYDARVQTITRDDPGEFQVVTESETITARFILLATGVVDILPNIPGLAELWKHGESVFLCPYCHGWEVRQRPWGVLVSDLEQIEWALFLNGWTDDLVVFTNAAIEVPDALQARLGQAKILLEERPIQKLRSCRETRGASGHHLKEIELMDGDRIEREALFLRTTQRQTDLVAALKPELSTAGYVIVDAQMQTSVPGIYAAGDATTPIQQALAGAADGARAAAMINHRLNTE